MTQRIKKHVEKALSSGFLAVTLVWGVAAFVVSMAPVQDSGDFRAAFPSGSSSSVSSTVSSAPAETPTSQATLEDTCSDLLDNEGDIALDAGDPDCDTVYNICNNSVDDDRDGAIDTDDIDCDGGWMN